MKKAFIIFFVFLLTQLATSLVAAAVMTVFHLLQGQDIQSSAEGLQSVEFFVLALLLSTILTVWILWKFSLVDISRFWRAVDGKTLVCFVVLMALVSLGMNVILEALDLPDYTHDALGSMSNSVLGAMMIAVLGPIAEELAFRNGIIDAMRKKGYAVSKAILVSAILFGLVHMNPSQTVFAAVIGIVLGWAYVRTGSLLVPVIMHIFNNSFAVISMAMSDDGEEEKIIDTLGGPVNSAVFVVACFVLAYLLYRYLGKLTESSAMAEELPEEVCEALSETENIENYKNNETLV